MFCIQVPMSEIIWPLKKSWKLRGRRERNMRRRPERGRGSREGFFLFCASVMRFNCTMPGLRCRVQSWRMLRSKLGGFSGTEEAAAGAQDAAVGPVGFAKENFSLARLGIKPTRDE